MLHRTIRTAGLDREALRQALPQAEQPVLLMVYAQLTGDMAYAEGFRPYIRKVRDYADCIPQDMIDDLHARLIDLLSAPVAPDPVALEPAQMKALMDICVGEEVPADYVPMLTQDLTIDRPDAPYGSDLAGALAGLPPGFRVIIVGGGFGGVCAAFHCKKAGLDFELFEKNGGEGGTWYENAYPNCGVDAPNHLYSYSFRLKHDWSRYFVRQPEIQAYIHDVAQEHDLAPHIRLNIRVDTVRYDTDHGLWQVETTALDGRREQHRAHAVILACGQLNDPKIPRIKGQERFDGPAFHTARWDDSVDLDGKRVALIGVGASSVQVGPGIVDRVAHLDIYQRSAQWVNKRANYTRMVTDGTQWVLQHVPHYARWYRFQLLWAFSDALFPALQQDPDWKGDGASISKLNHDLGAMIRAYMEEQLKGRPDLIEKCTPRFPPYGKRPLFDNGWFDTLKRDDVDLVTEGISEITADGIVTDDGVHHPADVIIYATGFNAAKMLPSVQVIGREGVSLRDLWGEEDPRAYMGITVPGFPNLFLIYGPNTNYAHGGSIVFNIECQTRYIFDSLAAVARAGASRMEVLPDAFTRYNEAVDARHAGMIWTYGGVTTWYKNSKGRVVTNAPWSMREYWELTRTVDLDAYTLS